MGRCSLNALGWKSRIKFQLRRPKSKNTQWTLKNAFVYSFIESIQKLSFILLGKKFSSENLDFQFKTIFLRTTLQKNGLLTFKKFIFEFVYSIAYLNFLSVFVYLNFFFLKRLQKLSLYWNNKYGIILLHTQTHSQINFYFFLRNIVMHQLLI